MIVGGIAMGLGIAMTILTMYYHVASDPIPEKSEQLFAVQLDSWDPVQPYDEPNEPPTQVTYMDAMEIMKSDIPTQQTIMFKTFLFIYPKAEKDRPYKTNMRVTFNDFFTMFNVPFISMVMLGVMTDDVKANQVVVIDFETNQRLYGGENSVGKQIKIEDREFTIVGVMNHWTPTPKFYDLTNGDFNNSEHVYLAFSFV